mgnify:CR=1 FL=1
MEIILASASPRRSWLLRQAGIVFKTVSPDIEEVIDETVAPEELVLRLSGLKAEDVAGKLGRIPSEIELLVIGADTLVIKDGILGKPADKAEAFNMLKALQGGWHEVITGITVVSVPGFKSLKGYERTRVKIRKMSDEAILNYINTGEPMDKAGAYGIQGIGALIVERIEGCYFNVVGLPLMRLGVILEEFGTKLI